MGSQYFVGDISAQHPPGLLSFCNHDLGIKRGIKNFREFFCGSWTDSAVFRLRFPVILRFPLCASPKTVGAGVFLHFPILHLTVEFFLHFPKNLRFWSVFLHFPDPICTCPAGKVQIGAIFCGYEGVKKTSENGRLIHQAERRADPDKLVNFLQHLKISREKLITVTQNVINYQHFY